ncbi:PLP-dependent transferase [Pseudovirgaria hyperparasitica]|uniref:PLP-dependent transferase n=1 Tax=Pseudovirgaria hyperparasitica TaxID=470096 RepID=A0A6A6WIM9_9PEZI|nr:PLP-dependent transferase [Pseudovirgaria hyperparasitica]KAF2762149.1 PLP-dependent transferase [Pseudovirgaria hyperparasitica]
MTNLGSGNDVAKIQFGHALKKDFLFDEKYINLNHGSFGTHPHPVPTALRSFQEAAEARPDSFIRYDATRLVDESRSALAPLLNAPADTLVFVPNSTTGVNTVLRNLVYDEGDVIIYFATIYGSCEKTVQYVWDTTLAESRKIDYVYPVEDEWLVEEFERTVESVKAEGKTPKLCIFDTVVSLPGVRMPFELLAAKCRKLGVLSCIDGAHGVGHIELDMTALDPDFFVSNCHKWLYTPRGCAVFYVPMRNQHLIRSTLPTSHGYIPKPKAGASPISNPLPTSTNTPFVNAFNFVGTIDTSPYLCVPAALTYRRSLGGESAIRNYCQTLALEGGRHVAHVLGTHILDNSTHSLSRCCMVNILLPLSPQHIFCAAREKGNVQSEGDIMAMTRNWIEKVMMADYGTFMPVMLYGNKLWCRLSAQVYLEMKDFEFAAEVLRSICDRTANGESLQE